MMLSIIILSLFLPLFQPLGDILDYIFKWFFSLIKNDFLRKLLDYLYVGVQCPKCISFWSSLIWSGDLVVAAATSIITYVIWKIIERI